MRKILDKMFRNKKLSILIPILVSALLYLLFIMFGVSEDKMNIIIATPIASVFWFFGAFLVVYVQVKNRNCPEVFLNFFEFLTTLFFGIYSIVGAISVVISGFQNFTPITTAGLLTYASIAWAHSKRT
ncbi:MAG: hypothetical protein E7561_03605 [Ruminococcaceae bacterium]|nr:hypothetical protein [Oscillospiraceae bacterium]